jgi:PD-(D/E)XK nuclease superfamily protein
LRERTGSSRLAPETVDAALAALRDALGELRPPPGVRGAAAVRGLAVDLERYLRHEAECGAGFEPALLEWSFGGDGEPAALEVDGVAVSGRVDRIDVEPRGGDSPGSASGDAPGELADALRGRRAIVRDYKGRNVTAGARWGEDGRLQAALYALAVRERLGVEVVGALYQPLGARDRRPRGLVRDDVPGRYVNGDRVDADRFEAGLEAARAAAAEAARALRAGRIAPCPERCSPQGCAHPGICRA